MSYLNKIKKLNTQKKIGILFIVSLVFINQYVWLEFFDSDGFLKPVSKLRMLFINFLILVLGLCLYFLKFSYKNIFKKFIYIFYLIFTIEILSIITMKILIAQM